MARIEYEHLVILDYTRGQVHHYKIVKNKDVNDEVISNLGFHPSACQWMVASSGNFEEIKHKGILV